MMDYEYYIQNKENIKEIEVSSLRFDDELNNDDYTNIFDIYDSKRENLSKFLFVSAIFVILLTFVIMLMLNIDTNLMFIVLFCSAAAVIVLCCFIMMSWAVNKIKAKKQIGVLIDRSGDIVSVYCRDQGVVKVSIYTDYWHSSKVKIGEPIIIYRIRNRYFSIKGYRDESN